MQDYIASGVEDVEEMKEQVEFISIEDKSVNDISISARIIQIWRATIRNQKLV